MSTSIITLTEEFRISVDPQNCTLQQRRILGPESKTPGQVQWISQGHYSNPEGCVRRAARLMALDGPEVVYLSIDIDVIDPGMAPGTGTPEPGGMLTRELRRAGDTVTFFRLYPASGPLSYDSARAVITDAPRVIFSSSVRPISARGHVALPDSLAQLITATAADGTGLVGSRRWP